MILTLPFSLATFNESGPADFRKEFAGAIQSYNRLTNSAGWSESMVPEPFGQLHRPAGARIPKGLVDTTARGGYSMTGSRPQTPHEMAAEYFLVGSSGSPARDNPYLMSSQFDWEFSQTPEETSWLASSWVKSHLSRPFLP